MELWASGFNAFRQLEFGKQSIDPQDMHTFRCILKSEKDEIIEVLLASHESTIGG